MHWNAFFSLLFLVGGTFAFESLPSVPRGWKFESKAANDTSINLRISLKQQNLDHFRVRFQEISSPSHENYGQHFDRDELSALLAPTEEAKSVAMTWLEEGDIVDVQDDGDFLLFRTNVEKASTLLLAEFGWYEEMETGRRLLRTLAYKVPGNVARNINFVQPTTRFGSIEPRVSMSMVLDEGTVSDGRSRWDEGMVGKGAVVNASCNATITPQCLQALYKTAGFEADDKCGNTVGYGSFLEEYARYSDFDLFKKVYTPNAAASTNFSVILINGGLNNQNSTSDSAEANLDQQYIHGVSYPTPITEFSVGGRGLLIPDGDSPTRADNTNEPYLEFLIALLKLPNWRIPNSISVSYGENEQEIPYSYAMQVCDMFGQLGARGKSVIFASGDSGVGAWCLSNDGKNITKFPSQFPAACPYVTSVGGTRYVNPEVAVPFSSGGFSDYWSRPWYQTTTIRNFLGGLGSKNAGYFNRTGRGFPDVAAQSYNYRVVNNGLDVGLLGTSCSAPTFNGIVALLNSERVKRRMPTLGFLNPWIYEIGEKGFNDVVRGKSTGCDGFSRFHRQPNGSPVIPGASWDAVKGWDAVTGFGTPDFEKLLKLMPGYNEKKSRIFRWGKNRGL